MSKRDPWKRKISVISLKETHKRDPQKRLKSIACPKETHGKEKRESSV